MDDQSSPQQNFPIAQIPVRKNGFQSPLNPYQVFSWIILFFELSVSFLIFLPPLSLVLKIIFACLITILMSLTCYNAYRATVIDPTDPKVIEEMKAKERGEIYHTELRHFCVICNTHVQPRTKHCGQCNRCVDVFDHHCIWLNNCIGAQNYRHFLRTIVFLFAATNVKLGFGTMIIVSFNWHFNEFMRNSREVFISYIVESDMSVLHHITIASCVINGLMWLLLIKLVILHIWLWKKGMTTYESIMVQREVTDQRKANYNKRKNEDARQKKKSRVIKDLNDDKYLADQSQEKCTNMQDRLNHQRTGIHLDVEEHDQEHSLYQLKSLQLEKSANKIHPEMSLQPNPSFTYSHLKSFKNKKLEIMKRGNSTQITDTLRAEKSLDNKSDNSMAMLNAEAPSFVNTTRDNKLQDGLFEEEKQDISINVDVSADEPKLSKKDQDQSIIVIRKDMSSENGACSFIEDRVSPPNKSPLPIFAATATVALLPSRNFTLVGSAECLHDELDTNQNQTPNTKTPNESQMPQSISKDEMDDNLNLKTSVQIKSLLTSAVNLIERGKPEM